MTATVGDCALGALPPHAGLRIDVADGDLKLAQLCARVCETSATASGTTVVVKARDLWDHKALPDVTDGRFVAAELGAHDSRFVVFTPV